MKEEKPINDKDEYTVSKWEGRHKLTADEKKNAHIAYSLAIFGVVGFLVQMLYFIAAKDYSIHDWLAVLTYWIVFIMPGYIADAGMLIWGGGKPLDRGKFAKDGRRLFGPGKTIKGFLLGPLAFGVPIALAIHGAIFLNWDAIVISVEGYISDPNVNYVFYGNNPDQLYSDLKLYLLGDANGNADWETFFKLIPRVVACAFGAAVGDLFGSWAKRRKNVGRGKPFWLVDQIDFLAGCLMLAGPFLLLFGFQFNNLNLHVFIMLIIITPSITVVANTLSFLTGHKKVPW